MGTWHATNWMESCVGDANVGLLQFSNHLLDGLVWTLGLPVECPPGIPC